MKRDPRLGISLGLNAVLAVALVLFVTHRPTANPPAVSATPLPDLPASPHWSPPDTLAPIAHNSTNGNWQQWIDQVRDAGVPRPVLARLVVSDFENRWEKRRHDLLQQVERGELDDRAYAEFEAEHDREQESELRLALGDDGFREWDRQNLLRDFDAAKIQLSAADADAVYRLKKDLARRQEELAQLRRNGDIDEGDFNDRQAAAGQQYQEQLKSALGDDRYALIHDGANEIEASLRRSLKGVNVTDPQLAALRDAQRNWNERRAELEHGVQENPMADLAYEGKLQALDAERDGQFERALGAEGYAAYQKNQDNRYQMMKHYANAWKLSDGDIDYLYSLLREHEQNTRDYKARARLVQEQGQPVDWDGVQQNLQEFSRQTIQTLRGYLGDDRFNRLSGNNVLELEN